MKRPRPFLLAVICAAALAVLAVLVLWPFPKARVFLDPSGMTVGTRFLPPAGFVRDEYEPGSFSAYVRDLPLESVGTPVRVFLSGNRGPYDSDGVLARPLLAASEQCADAAIRTRAEYLYAAGQFGSIRFEFNTGFVCDFATWSDGRRAVYADGAFSWVDDETCDASRASFERYLLFVFEWAYTGNLSRDCERVPLAELRAGDVFNRLGADGQLGHAVMVADVARDADGRVVFLLLQGNTVTVGGRYSGVNVHMPANPLSATGSPWFPAEDLPAIGFSADDLLRFS